VEHPLDDCRLKVARANEQFDALHESVVAFFRANPCGIVTNSDPQTGKQTFKVPEPPILPRSWGLDLGQACHNARSALDQMIFALAAIGGGGHERDRTAFPIYENRDEYLRMQGRGTRRCTVRDRLLAGVPEEWRQKVDDIQPYCRLENAYLDPLAVLADITNRDKHRLLQVAHVVIETPAFRVWSTGSDRFGAFEISYNLRSPEQPDANIKFEYRGGHSLFPSGVVMQPKTQVDDRLGLSVIFGEPPRDFTLQQIKDAIGWTESILAWFEPAFSPSVE
jgi:hypothetical protein